MDSCVHRGLTFTRLALEPFPGLPRLRCLRHRHPASEGNAAAAGRGTEADRGRVADHRPDVLERNAQYLRHHHRH